VDQKDVILALVGASAGLTGFALVFLGLVIAAYTALEDDAPASVRRPLQGSAAVIFLAFAAGVLALGAGILWLIRGGDDHTLYVVSCALFWVDLAAMFGSAFWTLRELVWD
jgi:hypothetical protein